MDLTGPYWNQQPQTTLFPTQVGTNTLWGINGTVATVCNNNVKLEIYYWTNFLLNAWYVLVSSKYKMAKFGTFLYASANLYTAIAFFQGALWADSIAPALYKTNDAWKWYLFYMILTALTWFAAMFGKVDPSRFVSGDVTKIGKTTKMLNWMKAFPKSFGEIMTLPTDVQRSDLALFQVLDKLSKKLEGAANRKFGVPYPTSICVPKTVV